MVGVYLNVAGLPLSASGVLYARVVLDNRIRGNAGGSDSVCYPDVSVLSAKIRQIKDVLIDAAVSVRNADKRLANAADLLGEIKANLKGIVKQYPLFANEAPQRIAYLNAITGLRKQLEALSFHPDTGQASHRLTLGTIDWPLSPPPLPRVPSPDGFSIPVLDPGSASEEEVGMAMTAVVSNVQYIESIRTGMWSDVNQYIQGSDAWQAESIIGSVMNFFFASSDSCISRDGQELSIQVD